MKTTINRNAMIPRDKIEEAALDAADKSDYDFMSVESGFEDGVEWAQQQIKPLFLDFENFCEKTRSMDHMIAMDEQASTGYMPFVRHRTTEELFELFLKSREQ